MEKMPFFVYNKRILDTQTHTEFLLSWEAPARKDPKRSRTWYITVGALGISAIAYALITSSYALAIEMIALIAVFVLFHRLPYHRYRVGISQNGFHLDETMYAWSDLKNFWILQGLDMNELHMDVKRGRDVRILIEGLDPLVVRDVLLGFLPQDPTKREKLLDYIIRFCKL
jgi:hypothetical protein